MEQERIEQERLEQERLEQERIEQERLEQERLEQERIEQERLEQERLEQERIEQESLEQERLNQDQLEQEEIERNSVLISEDQILLVQNSWELVVPVKEQTAELFYRKLFQTAPEVKPLFKDDIKAQGEKLVTAINLVVNSLNNLDHVVPALQDMGKRHVDYGVLPEHYDLVGSTLLWTFEQALGADFTEEVKQAWTTAYGIIASTMISATD